MEHSNDLSEREAKYQRFMQGHAPESLRAKLVDLPVVDAGPALFSSPASEDEFRPAETLAQANEAAKKIVGNPHCGTRGPQHRRPPTPHLLHSGRRETSKVGQLCRFHEIASLSAAAPLVPG